MPVSRLAGMAGIGVDRLGALADGAADPEVLRLENLDTDLPLPAGVVEATREAVGRDDANSYLPFLGTDELRRQACRIVSESSGVAYDWRRSTILAAGGLNGILDVLLAILEPGDEVVLPDPIYIGLVNRVRLAGGVPRFVRCEVRGGRWRLDRESLDGAVSGRTRAFLMMSPAMPSGAVLDREDWEAVAGACRAAGAWLLYDSAMERLLFDGLAPIHPASCQGMAERTITIGSVSKEYRMIGWRVGWIVAPAGIIDDVGLVSISNVVANVGIALAGAAVALSSERPGIRAATAELERRRDVLLDQLAPYAAIRPEGGWSLLLDATSFGLSGREASDRLLERGKVAATPMTGWGSERSAGYLRLVFSNEPVERLRQVGERFRAAFA